VFLFFAIAFLCGALYNLYVRDMPNAVVGFLLGCGLLGIHWSRTRKVPAVSPQTNDDDNFDYCCRCGTKHNVERRAYLITYSVIVITNKSHGAFRPICGDCSFFASLPYSFLTLIVGWWGLPLGPILTIQSVIRNTRGGVLITDRS
jgi:hypothetical protein